MMARPKQLDCRYEPPYPDHFTVLFVWSAPELVLHMPGQYCMKDYPHPIGECKEFE